MDQDETATHIEMPETHYYNNNMTHQSPALAMMLSLQVYDLIEW